MHFLASTCDKYPRNYKEKSPKLWSLQDFKTNLFYKMKLLCWNSRNSVLRFILMIWIYQNQKWKTSLGIWINVTPVPTVRSTCRSLNHWNTHISFKNSHITWIHIFSRFSRSTYIEITYTLQRFLANLDILCAICCEEKFQKVTIGWYWRKLNVSCISTNN